jgi:chaperone modulatory protein CbpM
MVPGDCHSGVVVDDETLTLEELAIACKVEPAWIVERVRDDILLKVGSVSSMWRFSSAELVRVRRLIAIERNFDANPELAGLVVDLQEELESARQQLRMAGIF